MANFEDIEDRLYELGQTGNDVATIMPKLREIDRLRQEKNAIILAHYYQIAPIQLIADKVGDSLALAQAARNIAQDKSLVLCSTVHFMAEMVKMLNPDKKVIIPDLEASCSIAEGMNPETVKDIRKNFPDAAIIAYINTTAEAKAQVDLVCTSANASDIVRRVKENQVVLLPDYYFAKNIFAQIDDSKEKIAYRGIENGRIALDSNFGKAYYLMPTKVPKLPKGTCIVHEQFTPEMVLSYRNQVDLVLAHPEVKPEVAALADMVGGTKKMIDYLRNSPAKKILFITECDMSAPLREAYPEKEFVTPCTLCEYMKKNSLDKIINSLRDEQYEINIPQAIQEKARGSLTKMFEMTRGGIR
jgi:quinolinate synthase